MSPCEVCAKIDQMSKIIKSSLSLQSIPFYWLRPNARELIPKGSPWELRRRTAKSPETIRAERVAISLNNFLRAAQKHAVFSVSLSDWLGGQLKKLFSRFPTIRITSRMKDSNHSDFRLSSFVEDSEREPANNGASNVIMN